MEPCIYTVPVDSTSLYKDCVVQRIVLINEKAANRHHYRFTRKWYWKGEGGGRVEMEKGVKGTSAEKEQN